MKTVLTLGSFDGVHRGHQALLKRVVSVARKTKAVPTALVFGIPPRLTQKLQKRLLLTTWPEKVEHLRRAGIKRIRVLTFDRQTSNMSAERFFRDRIVGREQATAMVVGPRVAFGKNRAGRLPELMRLGRQWQVSIQVVGAVGGHAQAVSSTAIRKALLRGDVAKANTLLGYRYSIAGRVVHGDHRGRQLGFPTANLSIDAGKVLPPGVYWVRVRPLGVDGLCNIGHRPTFRRHDQQWHVEVFLLGRVRSLYGRRLRVEFLRRLRFEKRFSGREALVAQIERDVTRVREWQRQISLQTR